MDELGQFRSLFNKLLIYPNRVEIISLTKTNIIPITKISNVSYNKFKGELLIETSGGEKVKFNFIGFSAHKKGEEALRLISSLG